WGCCAKATAQMSIQSHYLHLTRSSSGGLVMKKAFVFLVVISLCGVFPLTHSNQAMAQTAGSSAGNDQDLAKENAILRRQNAELRERVLGLESAKGATSAGTNVSKPQSSPASAMAADLPLKARVAQPPAPCAWCGFYAGVNLGASEDLSSATDTWVWSNNYPTGTLVGIGGGPLAALTSPL